MYVCIYTPQGFDLSTWYVSHILVSYCDAILSDVAGWRYTARINVEIKRWWTETNTKQLTDFGQKQPKNIQVYSTPFISASFQNTSFQARTGAPGWACRGSQSLLTWFLRQPKMRHPIQLRRGQATRNQVNWAQHVHYLPTLKYQWSHGCIYDSLWHHPSWYIACRFSRSYFFFTFQCNVLEIPLEMLYGCRSLSQMQESAQFLAGGQLPEQALGALLAKTKVKGIVGVVNLSPYDTWLETSAMKWGRKTNGEIVMPTLSLSKNLTVISYCERSAALQLMQDRSLLHVPVSRVPASIPTWAQPKYMNKAGTEKTSFSLFTCSVDVIVVTPKRATAMLSHIINLFPGLEERFSLHGKFSAKVWPATAKSGWRRCHTVPTPGKTFGSY